MQEAIKHLNAGKETQGEDCAILSRLDDFEGLHYDRCASSPAKNSKNQVDGIIRRGVGSLIVALLRGVVEAHDSRNSFAYS